MEERKEGEKQVINKSGKLDEKQSEEKVKEIIVEQPLKPKENLAKPLLMKAKADTQLESNPQ